MPSSHPLVSRFLFPFNAPSRHSADSLPSSFLSAPLPPLSPLCSISSPSHLPHPPNPPPPFPATASYRLLPHIIITSPIPPQDVVEFQGLFAPGVIGVGPDPVTKKKTAIVKNPRKDTVSREVLRHDKFKDKVELTRIRDHFICEHHARFFLSSLLCVARWLGLGCARRVSTLPCLLTSPSSSSSSFPPVSVESLGAYKPEELLPEAIQVLLGKIDSVEACLKAVASQIPSKP